MPDKRPGGGWAPMELIETLLFGIQINQIALFLLPEHAS